MIVDLGLRWIHILSAVILLGGTFFMRWALLPALQDVPDQVRAELQAALRRRWSRLVMITSGLLLVSGLVNAVLAIKRYEFPGGSYHMLVAVKLLLALGIFWISAMLAGRTAAAERFRQQMTMWLNVNVVLAVTLICLAGWMKMSDRQLKEPTGEQATAAAHALP